MSETFCRFGCSNHPMAQEENSSKHNTDTLTRFDSAPDAPTVRQDLIGEQDETHRLDPRAIAPLKVCPECSFAWETSAEWCPSCGTAFAKSERESSTATRVMPTHREPPLTRSARRRNAQAGAGGATTPARRTPQRPPQRPQSPPANHGFRNALLAVLAVAAIAAAFLAGQQTRQSQAEVDQSINQAVATAKQSAASSYRTAFEKMQAQAAQAIKAARAKGVAEGQASAQQQLDAQQQDNQSLFDSVTNCVLHGNC